VIDLTLCVVEQNVSASIVSKMPLLSDPVAAARAMCGWGATVHAHSFGCIPPRDQDYDVKNAHPK